MNSNLFRSLLAACPTGLLAVALCSDVAGANAFAQAQRPAPIVTTQPVGVAPAGVTPVQDQRPDLQRPPAPQEKKDEPAPAPQGPAPRLEAGELEHNFGRGTEGEKLSHTFRLKSSGQSDLVITSAKPTCGCTVAKLEVVKPDGARVAYNFGDALPPGSELTLEAQLDTKNKNGQATSKINIYCNDPRQIVTLGLSATVETYFSITPNSIQFNDLSVADSAERTFEVAGKKPGGFKLSLEDKPKPDGMQIELLPIDPDALGKSTRWKVTVKLGPGAREGNLGYPINLRSDEAVAGATVDPATGQTPTYGATVMVTARVQGLISFEPQYLTFGLVRPGQIVGRSLTVKTFDPNFSFSDIKVRLSGPNDQKPEFPHAASFTHVVKPAADNKSAVIELTLNGLPEGVDGSFQGRLIIETGHPLKPELQLLFSGVCRPGVSVPVPPPAPAPAPVTPPKGG
jgi:hypothetical protein